MYCFDANKCKDIDCPIRRLKISHCWEYFEKNALNNPEYRKKAKQCKKCNYKLGWDIGLITDELFHNKEENSDISDYIPLENKEINSQNIKRFCYETMECNNHQCPVRQQQIIKCFKFFEPRDIEEKKRITCCNRECSTCFYKSGWDLGVINEKNFEDVIERKKLKIKRDNQQKKNLIVEIYMAELSKKPLNPQEEMELAKKIAGDKKASEIFLLANLKLVTRIAKNFSSKMPIMDLIQEGNIGLIKAIAKFDYRLGYKFSTYAAYWIKYYMQKAVSEQATSISIPCHLIAIANKIKTQIQKFEEQFSKAPSLDELSQILGISKEKIINVLNVTRTPISIHSKVSNDSEEDETIEYFLEDKQSLTPEEIMLEKQKQQAIQEALLLLNERQKYVIENYYGLNCEELNLAEIGRKQDISRERVRQILQAALVKLSKHSSIIALNDNNI